MRPYIALLKARFAMLVQYRAAAFASLCTQLFWGLLKVMIITAFYRQTTSVQPMTLAEAITFIWLGQALLQLLPWNFDKEAEALVRTGNVSYEMVRPLDLYSHWFVRAFAIRTIPTLMRCIPIFFFATLFFGLSAPVSLAGAGAFAISLLFSAFLSASISTIVVISMFWTLSGEGLRRLMPHFAMILSGIMVPLPLFPDWLQPFLLLQPFRGIMDIPFRLYTGIIPAYEAPFYWAFQIVWTLIFVACGRCLMKRAVKRLVIQGG